MNLTPEERDAAMFWDFEPKSDLGRKLIELRRKYIRNGGELYSLEELELERALDRKLYLHPDEWEPYKDMLSPDDPRYPF